MSGAHLHGKHGTDWPGTPPRIEAAELSQALGITDFAYWETAREATFRGFYKDRWITVEKRVASRWGADGRKPSREGWLKLVRRQVQEVAELHEGDRLPADWVVVVVGQPPGVASGPAQPAAASPAAPVPRMTLDEAAQGQAEPLMVAEPKPYSAGQASELMVQARERGRQYLVDLIWQRRLVPAKEIADFWGITTQALGNRKRAGDVLGLVVNNRLWYPAALKDFLSREAAQQVCARLKGLPEIEQFLVLTNPHHALGGRTIAQALTQHMTQEVEQLLASVTGAG